MNDEVRIMKAVPQPSNFILHNSYFIIYKMGIKPDHWIRQQANEHGMIEPFTEKSIRSGVVSYGLSSYGYDIRISNEFKVFTNLNSTVVDPKSFNSGSFVDQIVEEFVIIPPNSFVLSRTVEYFRIPREVLVVCLGKSTYARCFSGDTKVSLLDGTAVSLEEMARRHENGEMFWGYSISGLGRIEATLLDAPRLVGQDSLIEITLDNEQKICCTPDHEFIRRDGRSAQAHDLRPNDSLMPLYRGLHRGYEMVYQPLNGHLYPTHRLADEWNLRNGIYAEQPGTHRHHLDHNRLNNSPWNIQRMEASEHIRMHNTISYGEEFDPAEHAAAIRDAFQELRKDDDWYRNFCQQQRRRANQFWAEEKYAQMREQWRLAHVDYWADEANRAAQRDRQAQFWLNNDEAREIVSTRSEEYWRHTTQDRRDQQAEIMRKIRLREEITEEMVRFALNSTGSIRGAARVLNCDRSVFRRFPNVIGSFRGTREVAETSYNHRIKSICELPGTHDVYCLTVPEAGNFALDAGVFVSNCGLIVNVTPLEPEWEGYLTLEISNTTPLPAKVYANEGIAQLLFFGGDGICEQSYKDKKGKYQGQVGVVLPRIEK